MMKKVIKIEMPMRSWFAGALGTPSAVRTNPKTITMRVKLVISMMSDGASVSSVITMTIWIAVLRFCLSLPFPTWRLINGAPGAETCGAVGAVGARGAAGAVGELSNGGNGVGPGAGVCACAGIVSAPRTQIKTKAAKRWGFKNIMSSGLFFPHFPSCG